MIFVCYVALYKLLETVYFLNIEQRKGFEIYSEYCNNHTLAIEELCSLQQDDKYGRFFEVSVADFVYVSLGDFST